MQATILHLHHAKLEPTRTWKAHRLALLVLWAVTVLEVSNVSVVLDITVQLHLPVQLSLVHLEPIVLQLACLCVLAARLVAIVQAMVQLL